MEVHTPTYLYYLMANTSNTYKRLRANVDYDDDDDPRGACPFPRPIVGSGGWRATARPKRIKENRNQSRADLTRRRPRVRYCNAFAATAAFIFYFENIKKTFRPEFLTRREVNPLRDAGFPPERSPVGRRQYFAYFSSRHVFRQSGSAPVRDGTVQEQKRQPEQKRIVALQQQPHQQ